MSKIFAGILVMTRLQLEENKPEELVALLQRRGKIETDNEYGFKWQSFVGVCEITSYGKGEADEVPEETMKRELHEELGEKAAKTILDSNPTKIYERIEKDGDEIYVWTCLVDKKVLKQIKLEICTGGLEILSKADLDNVTFSTFNQKDLTVKNADEINIFEVPKEAIKKAFEIF